MESYNTLFNRDKKIESPMAAFNNFIVDLGKSLSEIFGCDVFATNNCLFDDESILLFCFIKLVRVENGMGIKINACITSENQDIVHDVFSNRRELEAIFFKYLFILNDVRHNYDNSISSKYVETIIDEILTNKDFDKKIYLVPFKNKIFRNYDGGASNLIDKAIEKCFTKYTYVLNITKNGPIQYKWKLIRLLSSDLNESYSMENIRPLEKETIRDGLVQKENLHQFMVKLMYYGEF